MNLNLIPSKAKFQATRIKLQRKVGLATIVLLILWIAIGGVLFLLTGIMNVSVKRASANKKQVQESYNSLQSDIVTSQKLKYKAKMVGGVLSTRFEYGSSFETIQSLFPSTINLTSYDLRDGGVFEVKGVTTTRENVDLLEKTIEDINGGQSEKLTSAKLTGLRLQNNEWNFTMEVTLK
ncbi:MAG: hypothetical protein WAV41_03715 [Microgenomates group bacterium]